ncbi:MAG: hypothetical protein HMLIMOIP_001224 [Candidatus Nitrosomirales archaeon]|jgi:hypothetical protein
MTKIMNKKVFAAMLPATVIGIIAIALLTSNLNDTQAQSVNQQPQVSAGAKTPKQLFEEGSAAHYIKSSITPSTISIKRGATITVDITIENSSHVKDESVTLSNFHNAVRNFAPSAHAGLTDEQFDDLVAQGVPIHGEISVNDFITISPTTLTVAANSKASISMKISIPNNIPDEMLYKTIQITPAFDADLQYPSVVGKSSGITVEVLP